MQSAIQHLQSSLKGIYPDTEIMSFSNLIVQHLTGMSRVEILMNKNTIFSNEQRYELDCIIEKLKFFVPIQYILGETEFFGLPFRVSNSVLIPRPETEELVDWIQNENKEQSDLSILDIGTGSGCIAITLKHIFENAKVDAFDISENALAIAGENAKLNNVAVHFSNVDILNAPLMDNKWDIIVSNPPYIPELEKAEILPNVLNHEPHLALFVPDNDWLIFYRSIAEFANIHLHPGGKLYIEIHKDAGNECVEMLLNMGFQNVELRKDISGNDRMVKGQRQESGSKE